MNEQEEKAKQKNEGEMKGSCCSHHGATCSSKLTCSPCLIIWGAVFVILLVSYFLK